MATILSSGWPVLVVAAVALWVYWRVSRLTHKQKRRIVKRRVAEGWAWLESRGIVERFPAFVPDHRRIYRGLEALERNHALVRKECLELLARRERLVPVERMGGGYTRGGIHVVRWNSFMLKSGHFIPENSALAPETTRLLQGIPGLVTAFFSILEPRQYITPHFGYYKGFLRYHLGVIIPGDNADQSCWLRVNDDEQANDRRDRSAIDEGQTYHWHEGEGVLFDDTYLHDAANESDEVRVVLWLDLRKPMPWYLQTVNIAFIWLSHLDPSLKRIRRIAAGRDADAGLSDRS